MCKQVLQMSYVIRCRPTVSAYCFPFIRQLFSFLHHFFTWGGGNQNASTLAGAFTNLGHKLAASASFPPLVDLQNWTVKGWRACKGPLLCFTAAEEKSELKSRRLKLSHVHEDRETLLSPPYRYISSPFFKNYIQGYGSRENATPLLDTYIIIICAVPSVFFFLALQDTKYVYAGIV